MSAIGQKRSGVAVSFLPFPARRNRQKLAKNCLLQASSILRLFHLDDGRASSKRFWLKAYVYESAFSEPCYAHGNTPKEVSTIVHQLNAFPGECSGCLYQDEQ